VGRSQKGCIQHHTTPSLWLRTEGLEPRLWAAPEGLNWPLLSAQKKSGGGDDDDDDYGDDGLDTMTPVMTGWRICPWLYNHDVEKKTSINPPSLIPFASSPFVTHLLTALEPEKIDGEEYADAAAGCLPNLVWASSCETVTPLGSTFSVEPAIDGAVKAVSS